MFKAIGLVALLFLLVSPSFADTSKSINHENISHVIYITLDGTRWQDIFVDRSHFKKLWQKYATSLKFYGAPDSNTVMETASTPISQPSYHAQMAGEVQPCDDNGCGRIMVETFPESIIHKLKLDKREAATFASWDTIAESVESIPETTLVNAGNIPMTDPITHKPDQAMDVLNQQQETDHPDSTDRYDQYTFGQALYYLEKYQPKFLWISFDDADESAHDRDLNRYHLVLDYYDNMFDVLFTKLKTLHIDKNTLVIITTDHGRGDGENWTSHGPKYPESKRTWAFTMNGELKPRSKDGDKTYYSTLSIRPTIEAALHINS